MQARHKSQRQRRWAAGTERVQPPRVLKTPQQAGLGYHALMRSTRRAGAAAQKPLELVRAAKRRRAPDAHCLAQPQRESQMTAGEDHPWTGGGLPSTVAAAQPQTLAGVAHSLHPPRRRRRRHCRHKACRTPAGVLPTLPELLTGVGAHPAAEKRKRLGRKSGVDTSQSTLAPAPVHRRRHRVEAPPGQAQPPSRRPGLARRDRLAHQCLQAKREAARSRRGHP